MTTGSGLFNNVSPGTSFAVGLVGQLKTKTTSSGTNLLVNQQSAAMVSHWRQDPMYLQFQRFVDLCMRSPGFALSLLYLTAGFAGLLFNVALLASFGLDVLPYLELTDLLLAPLHYPQMLLYLLGSLLLFVLIVILGLWQSYRNGKPRIAHGYGWLIWPILFIYLILAALVPAKQRIEDLRQGQQVSYRMQLVYPHQVVNDKGVTLLPSVQLISRSSVYWFVRQGADLLIVPHANVASLQPLFSPAPAVAGLHSPR